ncbi:WXG100 family type VII secretion target [Mycolicibacterium sp. P9-64]|uniref:WXG100 family type VII secretion target n=1 Tax=Mycolicibacterium sp. P9-64 TaxID=2024612 RepID=UPI0011EF3DF4|nr:WXG100 family type VII secretion target [Mycolicibacterium sp. P9-64]KAA0079696.1 WXG100 family type VII secretion target [Mycolicibacterium sp. P9-64]
MSELQADVSVITAEAGNFDHISTSLQGVMAQVDGTAGQMHANLQGESGTAAQAAFVRYQEAAQVQRTALDEIVANLNAGGHKYDTTDSDQAGALHQTFSNLNINH